MPLKATTIAAQSTTEQFEDRVTSELKRQMGPGDWAVSIETMEVGATGSTMDTITSVSIVESGGQFQTLNRVIRESLKLCNFSAPSGGAPGGVVIVKPIIREAIQIPCFVFKRFVVVGP